MNSTRFINWLAVACLSATIASCSDQQPNKISEQYTSPEPVASYESPPIPTPAPSPNWDEAEESTYYYIASVSEEDRAKGQAAGDVLAFRYLGTNGQSEHILARVANDGSIYHRAFCKDPCKIVRYEDGRRIAFERGSVIGAAFEDALAGRLEQKAQVKKRLVMSALDEAAWNRLGSGCACAFSLSRNSKPMFLAGGDDNLIVRPYGEDAICKLREGRMQEMFNGGTDLQCGGARIIVGVAGDIRSGEDGYSSPGKLSVSNASEERTWSGEWGCAC